MKELRFFYAPNALTNPVLPGDEAIHALKVLRLGKGDSLNIIDGQGHLIEATITEATKSECHFKINNVVERLPLWPHQVHLAVAPTKNIDRMEWMVEKITEIGVDRISFLNCRNSERRVVKMDRLERIAVSAMKQSHKFYKPTIDEIIAFDKFINQPFDGLRFIAHCYDDISFPTEENRKKFLLEAIREGSQNNGQMATSNMQVLIGPEGDFSVEEVRQAVNLGYIPVSLGEARLRTETAAMVAVHLMQLSLFRCP